MFSMNAEKSNRKDVKTRPEGPDSMGAGMRAIMEKCCSEDGAFSGCETVMKSMMTTMQGRSCWCRAGGGEK